MPANTLATAATAVLVMLASSLTVFGDEKEKRQAAGLPGVEEGYSIVQPAPEPEDVQAEYSDGRKRFKAGNWDVEVSGYIWYQVGASSNGR